MDKNRDSFINFYGHMCNFHEIDRFFLSPIVWKTEGQITMTVIIICKGCPGRKISARVDQSHNADHLFQDTNECGN